ncbi:MAG: hypothetical protein HY820_38125 [Acidobacteria bacterium]|nr:hypothetical protein [Acidobacteriota bacterium]
MRSISRVSLVSILFAAVIPAQTAKTVLGTVTEFRPRALELGIKSDDGKSVTVKVGPETQVIQVPAGAEGLSKAKPIKVTDVALGDRLMVSFVEGMTDARRIVLVSSTDLAERNENERIDWQKRGISGTVSAKAGREISIESRSSQGAEVTTVVITDQTRIKRYAADSVKFSDAESSTLAEVAIGDQVRTRGERNASGNLLAEDIVFGTFLTRVGTVTTINRDPAEIIINDLTSKKAVTIRFTADSRVKKMPSMNGGPGGEQHRPPDESGPPVTMAQLLERIPVGSFDDFKVGSAVVVTSTRGATPDRATAIMAVANVDALIQFAQRQSGSAGNPLEAMGRMHGGMMGGPNGFSLPAMLP